jgi:hypothetical protein
LFKNFILVEKFHWTMKTIFLVLLFLVCLTSAGLTELKAALDTKEKFSTVKKQKNSNIQEICTKLREFYGSYDPNSGSQCTYLDSCSPTLETDAALTCQPGFGGNKKLKN